MCRYRYSEVNLMIVRGDRIFLLGLACCQLPSGVAQRFALVLVSVA